MLTNRRTALSLYRHNFYKFSITQYQKSQALNTSPLQHIYLQSPRVRLSAFPLLHILDLIGRRHGATKEQTPKTECKADGDLQKKFPFYCLWLVHQLPVDHRNGNFQTSPFKKYHLLLFVTAIRALPIPAKDGEIGFYSEAWWIRRLPLYTKILTCSAICPKPGSASNMEYNQSPPAEAQFGARGVIVFFWVKLPGIWTRCRLSPQFQTHTAGIWNVIEPSYRWWIPYLNIVYNIRIEGYDSINDWMAS